MSNVNQNKLRDAISKLNKLKVEWMLIQIGYGNLRDHINLDSLGSGLGYNVVQRLDGYGEEALQKASEYLKKEYPQYMSGRFVSISNSKKIKVLEAISKLDEEDRNILIQIACPGAKPWIDYTNGISVALSVWEYCYERMLLDTLFKYVTIEPAK